MTLQDLLTRFEEEVLRISPESAERLRPPADEDAFARLEAAVAPRTLPDDVRTLYAWRDGWNITAFAGRQFLSIDELIREREFLFELLSEPPSWIPMFLDASGARFFVEAVPATGTPQPGLWQKGKDWGPELVYTGIEPFFQVLVAAYEEGLVSVRRYDNGFYDFDTTEGAYGPVKQRIDPFTWTDHSFFPTMDWPSTWLDSLGIDKAAWTPTGGPFTPIADATARAGSEADSFTVAGRIVRSGSQQGLLWMSVRDDSGDALLLVEGDRSPLLDYVGIVEVEADIEVGPDIVRPETIDADHYPGHPARVTAIRLHPPEVH